jgi:hypothetical protein
MRRGGVGSRNRCFHPKLPPPRSWVARFIGCHHGQASAPQPTPERADQSMIIGLFIDPENNTTAIDSCSHQAGNSGSGSNLRFRGRRKPDSLAGRSSTAFKYCTKKGSTFFQVRKNSRDGTQMVPQIPESDVPLIADACALHEAGFSDPKPIKPPTLFVRELARRCRAFDVANVNGRA